MSDYTLGDKMSFGVFLLELTLLVVIGISTFLARLTAAAVLDESENAEQAVPLDRVASPAVLYDRAFEVNREVNSEIQGVENGLLAILAAVAAVAVLALDKLTDVGVFAMSCIVAAFLVCGIGYIRGRAAWRRKFEDPTRFFSDLIVDPDEAYKSGAQDLIKTLFVTQGLLNEKRRWAMVAMLALIVGTLAGVCQKVIHFERDDPVRPRCGSGDPSACRARSSREVSSSICCVPAQAVQLDSSPRRARS